MNVDISNEKGELIIRILEDGSIYIKGKLLLKDKEVYEALYSVLDK
jgi:hypothetical protein